MSEHFNKLSPAEAERLAYLLEEMGEAQQAIGKILRHGYNSRDPTNPNHKGNRCDLEREIVDVLGAIELMYKKGDILKQSINDMVDMKTYKYMHHQG